MGLKEHFGKPLLSEQGGEDLQQNSFWIPTLTKSISKNQIIWEADNSLPGVFLLQECSLNWQSALEDISLQLSRLYSVTGAA